MKCGIIKKITSPPSHVIMSDSGGSRGSEEEAPFLIPDQERRRPRTPRAAALRDCLRRWRGRYSATGRDHKRTLLSGGNEGAVVERGPGCLDVRVGVTQSWHEKRRLGGCLEYV